MALVTELPVYFCKMPKEIQRYKVKLEPCWSQYNKTKIKEYLFRKGRFHASIVNHFLVRRFLWQAASIKYQGVSNALHFYIYRNKRFKSAFLIMLCSTFTYINHMSLWLGMIALLDSTVVRLGTWYLNG